MPTARVLDQSPGPNSSTTRTVARRRGWLRTGKPPG